MVVVGCLPAAVVGILLDDWVEEHVFNAYVVSAALIVYGIIFIVMEHRNRRLLAQVPAVAGKHAKPSEDGQGSGLFKIESVDEIDAATALKIGLFQCLAIIPGTSRSGSTIIGGMLAGCSRVAAAEFTFFLAIPVMLGWGLLKAVKFLLAGMVMTSTEIVVLVVGIVTAFVVSVLSIKFLMGYIKKNDFAAFGWYRIVVGVVVLGYFGVKALGIL